MAYELTKEDVKILRAASMVSFTALPNSDHTAMVGTIRCTLKEKRYGKEFELTHEIPAEVRLRQFTHNVENGAMERNRWRGFGMIHAAQYCEEWATIARHIIKVGDKLTLHFVRGGWDSEGLRGVNFCGDTLQLVVNREKADLWFHIDQTICDKHSSARMVQRA